MRLSPQVQARWQVVTGRPGGDRCARSRHPGRTAPTGRRLCLRRRAVHDGCVKQWVFYILGVLLVLFGGLWTLQGLDVVGGSAMSGKVMWAIIGPVVAIVGIVLVVAGARQRRSASSGTR
jgi:hypothetical protein